MNGILKVSADSLRRLLENAQTRALQKQDLRRQAGDAASVNQAMADLEALRFAYREALIGQAHSARVGEITANLDDLASLLSTYGSHRLTETQQEEVRTRIKTWHHDSRLWIQSLPHLRCLESLPRDAGESLQDRIAAIKQLWLEAGGAWFGPLENRRSSTRPGLPSQLRLSSPLLPDYCLVDPMDRTCRTNLKGKESPRWSCNPNATIQLLDMAREALLLEVGGKDKGGITTFAQRRRRSSLKDAFAFSCLQIYERAVGPKTARQLARRALDDRRSPFEQFVAEVHRWAIGPEAPGDWALGPDPIRKAIATQRAWQKLFKVAGCKDEREFCVLPPAAQEAAVRMLKPDTRNRLKPAALPLI